jgi:hypothetical protein
MISLSQLATPPRTTVGRGLVLLGLLLGVGSVVGYGVQLFYLHSYAVPWYAPVASTVGVVLLAWSLAQRRTWWRILSVGFVALLAGVEWHFVIWGSRLPTYTGPVAVGQPFPNFRTTRADGTPFTDADLKGDRNTVLVFFRGRW